MNILTLSPNLRNFLGKLINNGDIQKKCVSIGIARAIASKLELPQKITNPKEFYNLNLRILVDSEISKIMKYTIVQIDDIQDYTYRIWATRVNSSNLSHKLFSTNKTNALGIFLGFDLTMTGSMCMEIEEHPLLIAEVNNNFLEILSETKGIKKDR